MRRINFILFFNFLALFFCVGMGERPKEATRPVRFEVLANGNSSGIRQAGNAVVRDAESWAILWARIHEPVIPEPAAPTLNFGSEMAVAVFAGEFPSGGYGVTVTKIEETPETIAVTYRVKTPRPNAVLSQSLTQPYELVKLAKSAKHVAFLALPTANRH